MKTTARLFPIAAVLAALLALAMLTASGGTGTASAMQTATPVQSSNGFLSVSAGGEFACGLRSDGRLICWGNSYGPGNTTEEVYGDKPFISVSAGDNHACGVQTDGAVACDGWGQRGEATPPEGTFASVSAGVLHTCGVKAYGTVACWGANTDYSGEHAYGQATPPQGSFTSVSAGGYHTCGVRTDGTVACWGSDEYGQAKPPTGVFTSVSPAASIPARCGPTARWSAGVPTPAISTMEPSARPRRQQAFSSR